MSRGTLGLELRVTGGANRDRTGDLLLAKQALSQLSYGPDPNRTRENVVRPDFQASDFQTF